MSGFKEWWIHEEDAGQEGYFTMFECGGIHVIEKAALTQALAQVEALKEELAEAKEEIYDFVTEVGPLRRAWGGARECRCANCYQPEFGPDIDGDAEPVLDMLTANGVHS